MDLTRDLLNELDSHQFVPAPARNQVLRSVAGEPVAGFLVTSGVHVGGLDSGLGTLMRVGLITTTRFVHITWHEEPVGSGDDEDRDDLEDTAEVDVADQIEQFLADTLQSTDHAALATRPETLDLRLTVAVQTVPLRQIADVRTTHTYARTAGSQTYTADFARVVVLCSTLDTLSVEEIPCEDPDCEATHGFEGDAMQDAVVFTANAAHDDESTIEAVLAFAEALEIAWAK